MGKGLTYNLEMQRVAQLWICRYMSSAHNLDAAEYSQFGHKQYF